MVTVATLICDVAHISVDLTHSSALVAFPAAGISPDALATAGRRGGPATLGVDDPGRQQLRPDVLVRL